MELHGTYYKKKSSKDEFEKERRLLIQGLRVARRSKWPSSEEQTTFEWVESSPRRATKCSSLVGCCCSTVTKWRSFLCFVVVRCLSRETAIDQQPKGVQLSPWSKAPHHEGRISWRKLPPPLGFNDTGIHNITSN